jgi:ComF family protein
VNERSLNELSNRAAAKFDIAAPAVAAVRAMVSALLPQRCALCAEASGEAMLCAPCMNALPVAGPACPRCALPSPGAAVCGACLRHPPIVERTLAACLYAFPLDRLVQALKYGRQLALAVPLGDALAAAVMRAPAAGRPDALVPLPLAARRQRERGFNQAIEIARVVGRRTARPLCHALRRPVDRPAQAGLSLRERIRNVRGAFVVAQPVAGSHLAIVDDVMTTGATLDAAARALRAAGAVRVDAWVVARALPPRGR